MRSNGWMAVLLVLLGVGVGASAVLGPLVTGTIDNSLLSASVAGMAVVMYLRDDADGSLGMALAFTGVSACLAAFTVHLYRPLLTPSSPGLNSTAGLTGAASGAAAAERPRPAESAARR